MTAISRSRLTALAAGAVAVAALVTGCSSGNSGGDTTCKTYLGQSGDEQTETVRAMLKEQDQSTNGLNVNAAKLSATAYCNTIGEPDSKLKDMSSDAGSMLDSFLN